MSALNDGFDQPQDVNDLSLAFGGDMSLLLPAYAIIPPEFRSFNSPNEWSKFVSRWFFSGATLSDLTPRDDVDPKAAIRHIKAILASWEPKHEHKKAGAAWLLSRWFKAVTS